MIQKIIYSSREYLYFLELKVVFLDKLPVRCENLPRNEKEECVEMMHNRLSQLQENVSFYPEEKGLVSFGLEDLLVGSVVRGSISAMKFLGKTRSGKYVLEVVENGVSRTGTVIGSVYKKYLAKYFDTTGKFIKKMAKRPKALKKLKIQKNLRKARLEKLHYERYTIEGILERMKNENLKLIKGEFDRLSGYTEYFLSNKMGVLRSVKIREKNGAISMWMPRSIKGKGYTTALYVAISRMFKKPIIMSKNTTSDTIKNGVLVRGGKYIWSELAKTGKTYIKNGRTYFDAN